MARYTGPKCRRSRRVGMALGLKGIRDESMKCDLEQPPGGRRSRRFRLTEYGLHLREVQRVKWYYGVLYKQFLRYYEEAERRPGNTGQHLLQILECRLDNVVHRLRFGITRAQARQMVTHGHIRVNGKKVAIPSYQVKAGDEVDANPRERSTKLLQSTYELFKDRDLPSWLSVEEGGLKGTVLSLPKPDECATLFEPRLVVEYMSR